MAAGVCSYGNYWSSSNALWSWRVGEMGVPRRVSLNSAFHAPLVYTFLPTGQAVGSFYPGNRGNRRISFRETSLLASTISFVGTIVVVKSPQNARLQIQESLAIRRTR